MTEPTEALNDAELRIRGIAALNKALGVSATLKFLALMHQEPIDYVNISQHLYEEQTIDEIFTRARENWQG